MLWPLPRVGQQLGQQIAMARKIPQVMVRIDDRQLRFEDVFAVQGEPGIVDAGRAARCDAGDRSCVSRRRQMAKLIHRRMQDLRQHALAVGDDEAIEIDEAMALALVVGDDLASAPRVVADFAGGKFCILLPV